jgi:SAM-dependent methyltransferase
LFDAEIARHDALFRQAIALRPDDVVLDVGCGAGESTRAAAAVAARVVGIDISAALIEHARRVDAGANTTYVVADAAAPPFGASEFTLCISRFGAMFFREPPTAFRALAETLRRGGRLVLLVWQGRERNEWATAVRDALAPDAAVAPVEPGSDPFSLGDRDETTAILTDAGFADVRFVSVEEPVYYGPDVDTAYGLVMSLREPTTLVAALSPVDRDAAAQRLRTVLAHHWTSEDGVQFASSAWIVTARRP